MESSDRIPTSEAASRLGVSPRRLRALIEGGQLNAERIGRQWLVSAADVRRYRELRPRAGRPLSARRAWALLFMLSGERPDWVEPRDRSDLRHHLSLRSPARLVAAVRKRARLDRLRAHPGDLPRMRESDLLVLSGASAAGEHDLDLHAPGVVEAYVAAEHLDALGREFPWRPSEGPNVFLHVAGDFWPFDAAARIAPAAAVAVDLLEADDERSRRAGRDLFRRLPGP
jgi:excisionase family DNA binding protein